MYIIQYSTFTLFYKNGVLSRRRPARVNIEIGTMKKNYKIKKCALLSSFSCQLEYTLVSGA